MSAPTCGEVRRFLGGLGAGTTPPVDPETFRTLSERGAVSGSLESPMLTPVGRHVLKELEIRAYRTDPLPLDQVAEQLTRVLGDMDTVAKNAEYFLAELGPVTPREALPLLRPVAMELANRREAPEDLALQFRNAWGSVEVMGGHARDRLLAAALMHAAGASIDRIYSPMMTIAESVRELVGPHAPGVTVAALLTLNAPPDAKPAWDAYLALRKTARTEEGAAMLAATGRPPAELLKARSDNLGRLVQGTSATPDQSVAAGYLTVRNADPGRHLPRVAQLSRALEDRFQNPVVPAAILAMVDWLDPGELVNWVDKATDVARSRTLAPSQRELAALGLALVLGLPPSEFTTTTQGDLPLVDRLANLVAINAWVYGELVPSGTTGGAIPAGGGTGPAR